MLIIGGQIAVLLFYVQYGAGSYANANSPVQIELQHTHDKATFEKNYKAYVELARDSAIKYGIPLTLDTPYNQPGIKSHLWVTQNIWVIIQILTVIFLKWA